MKGKDQLENFIRSNRDAFDDKEAPVSVWENLQSTLHPVGKTGGWWNELVLWRSAAVFFIAVSAYLFFSEQKPQQRDDGAQVALNEFDDVEAYYIGEISQKVELIESIANDEGEELTPDFQRLEAMYLVLKEEMKNRPSKKVKDALVLNLLVRIDLLNEQLHKREEEDNGDDSNRTEI